MASATHLARLKEGAVAWNRWRQVEALARPDLQGLSLTLAQKQWGETNGGPINFAKCMLREADLRHATLIDADLAGASLIGADLSGARLRNADLRNADLAHVRFNGADVEDARFAGANLSGADLSGARNLRSSQIEAAQGDAKTLLPPPLVAPWARHDGAVVEPRIAVSAEALKAAAKTYCPSALHHRKLPEPDRFGRALGGLPRLDVVADQARCAFNEPPPPRLDTVADKARHAVKAFPRPARAAEWTVLALRGLPHAKLVAIAGLAGLLVVFGLGGVLALRALDRSMDVARDAPTPAVVAETHAETQKERAPVAPAPNLAERPRAYERPEKEEPPQRLTVAEVAAPAAVEDIGGAGAAVHVTRVDKGHPIAVATVPVVSPVLPVQDLVTTTDHAADPLVRLAFSMRAEAVTGASGKPVATPVGGSAAQAFIESYLGRPVAAGSVQDVVERIDLPKPATLAKAAVPEVAADAPQTARTPTSVVDYLSMPKKSSGWIEVFIESFYLSGKALDDADLRRIYSHEVDYFGKHKTSLDKVAREKARYYRLWPKRHYELVPGSIDIVWKSPDVADVSFTYQYKVSAQDRKTRKGRGRAHLTLDLRGHAGLIVREDGEVIAHN